MDKDFIDGNNAQTETVVGPSVKIQGDLNSEGNIRIEGQVSGKVKTTQSVYVGQSAKITADVLAGNAVISGEVQGNLKVNGNLVMESTAKVTGDIACAILRVEDGAVFSGKCTMGNSAPIADDKSKTRKAEAEPELEQ